MINQYSPETQRRPENNYLESLESVLQSLEWEEIGRWIFVCEKFFDQKEEELMNEFAQNKSADIYEIMNKEADLQDAIMIASLNHCLKQYNSHNQTNYKLEEIITLWADWWTWSKNITPWASDFDYFFIIKNYEVFYPEDASKLGLLHYFNNQKTWEWDEANKLKLPTRIWDLSILDSNKVNNLKNPTIGFIKLMEHAKQLLWKNIWNEKFIELLKKISIILLNKDEQREEENLFQNIVYKINNILRNLKIEDKKWNPITLKNITNIESLITIHNLSFNIESTSRLIFQEIKKGSNTFSSYLNRASSNRLVYWNEKDYLEVQNAFYSFYSEMHNEAWYLASITHTYSLDYRPQYFDIKQHVKRAFEIYLLYILFWMTAKSKKAWNIYKWNWINDALEYLKKGGKLWKIEFELLSNSFKWLWELRLLNSYYCKMTAKIPNSKGKFEDYYHETVNVITPELYSWTKALVLDKPKTKHLGEILNNASTVCNKLFLLRFVEQPKKPQFIERRQKRRDEIVSSFWWKISNWELFCEKQTKESEIDYFIRIFDIISLYWCHLSIETEKELFRAIEIIFPNNLIDNISITFWKLLKHTIGAVWSNNSKFPEIKSSSSSSSSSSIEKIWIRVLQWIANENFWKCALYLSRLTILREILPWYWNIVWIEQWPEHYHDAWNETLRSIHMLKKVIENSIFKNLIWISSIKVLNTSLLLANLSLWHWISKKNHWKIMAKSVEEVLGKMQIKKHYATHELNALKFYIENHHILMKTWIASAVATWHNFAAEELKRKLVSKFWENDYLAYVPWLIAISLATIMARQPMRFETKSWEEIKPENTQEWQSIIALLVELIHWWVINDIENSNNLWQLIAKQLSDSSDNINNNEASWYLELYSKKNKKLWHKLIISSIIKWIMKWEISWFWALESIWTEALIIIISKNINYNALKSEYALLNNNENKKSLWKFEDNDVNLGDEINISACNILLKIPIWTNSIYRLACFLSAKYYSIKKLSISKISKEQVICELTITRTKINNKTQKIEKDIFTHEDINNLLNEYCLWENDLPPSHSSLEETNGINYSEFKKVSNLWVVFISERKLLEIKWEDTRWIFVRLMRLFLDLGLNITNSNSVTDWHINQFFNVFEFEWNIPRHFEWLVTWALGVKN